eukprot:906636-Pelagomonas_calceolata.AAC.1
MPRHAPLQGTPLRISTVVWKFMYEWDLPAPNAPPFPAHRFHSCSNGRMPQRRGQKGVKATRLGSIAHMLHLNRSLNT